MSLTKNIVMKRLILSSIVLFISTLSIQAQPPGGRGGRPGGRPGGFDPEEMIKREKESVFKKVENLTADQTELINGIYDEFGETLSETIQEARKNRNWREMRPKMQALREEKDLLMKDVLNEHQFEAYLSIVESQRERRSRKRNGNDSTATKGSGI